MKQRPSITLPRLATASLVAGTLLLSGCTSSTDSEGHTGTEPVVKPSPPTDAGIGGKDPSNRLHGKKVAPKPLTTKTRPNILQITVDDAAPKDLPYMPLVRKLLRRQGTTFTQGIAPTPLCVPARASLLSGKYAHNHGAGSISGEGGGFDAFKPQDGDTLPVWLQNDGYDTMFLGKYINGYVESDIGYQPPGWTTWRPTVDPSTYNYEDPKLLIDGKLVETHTYNSVLLQDQSKELLTQAGRASKPWYMWVNYVAPHIGGPHESDDPSEMFPDDKDPVKTAHPEKRDQNTFDHLPLSDTPDMFEKDTSDKVLLKGTHDVISDQRKAELTEAHQQRVEALQSVDRAVRATIRTLRRTHQLDNTYILFTSDNGYALGEHNLGGKNFYFKDVQTVPMVLRGPGIPRGKKVGTPVTNVDWAPTIAALAGATPGPNVDGVNVLPYIDSGARARVVPVEAYSVAGRSTIPNYTGIQVGQWVYVRKHETHRREELYDLKIDPYELVNLAKDTRFHDALKKLRRLAKRYDNCAASSCPESFYK